MAGKNGELDPRQTQTLANYLDPKSDTFGNLTQSAMKAGYKRNYAENLTAMMPSWLKENKGRAQMLLKAERNLDTMLDLDDEDVGKLRVKADITKFVTERLNSDVYSTKTQVDHTSKGEKIGNIKDIQDLADEFDKKLEERYRAGSSLNSQLDSEEQDTD